MHKPIKAIVAASLLLLSGNAAAIMMNDQLYGRSAYSLHDIDMSIQFFRDDVSSRKDRRNLKRAIRLDRRIERLINKTDSAIVSNNSRKMRRISKRLTRKERKLLAILADYLPSLDALLLNGSMLPAGNIPFTGDIPPPPPDIFLSQLDLVTEPAGSNPDGNTLPGTVTTSGVPAEEIVSVPEPSMFALLGLGLTGLMLAGRRWRL